MKAKENKRITFEKENDQSFHMMVNKLFRLPWTMSDNAMTWFEPTRKCNITCDACFAINNPESQKTLSQIKKELETLLLLRRCDAMLIAVRMMNPDWPFDFYVETRRVDISGMAYFSDNDYGNLTTLDIFREIKKVLQIANSGTLKLQRKKC